MAAAKNYTGPKVLRVGVFRGTKVTEERIIRERVTVTVGTTERNTFTVVAPEVPPSFELFSMEGGQYVLNFTDRMEGRVALAEGVKSLNDLRTSGAKRVRHARGPSPASPARRPPSTIDDTGVTASSTS